MTSSYLPPPTITDFYTAYPSAIDQTAMRTSGTTFTNNTTRRMRVHITVVLTVAGVGQAAGANYTTKTGGTTFTAVVTANLSAGAAVSESTTTQFSFEVDPGGTYSVTLTTTGAGTSAFGKWIEVLE